MQTYVIRRPGVAAAAHELDAALARLRWFEERAPAFQARWMHSYALRETDGRFALTCVFQADSASTLERHAAQVSLPAQEVLAVSSTVRERDFAPTRVYQVRRRNAWRTAAELQRSAAISRRVGNEEMARALSWLRSYVIRENDGTLGTVCLYQATSAEVLREHASRVGMPADEILPVIGRVVFRDDPTPLLAGVDDMPA